jgi:hypothetical protein
MVMQSDVKWRTVVKASKVPAFEQQIFAGRGARGCAWEYGGIVGQVRRQHEVTWQGGREQCGQNRNVE